MEELGSRAWPTSPESQSFKRRHRVILNHWQEPFSGFGKYYRMLQEEEQERRSLSSATSDNPFNFKGLIQIYPTAGASGA